jgi:LPLT family lysophospholipid transporter-like MFS transporter
MMLLIGTAGGLFIVPINAALQEVGHKTIGSGSAVAILNFFANLGMLIAVGLYTLAEKQQVDVVYSMMSAGLIMLLLAISLALCLPKTPAASNPEQ